LIKHPCWTRAN